MFNLVVISCMFLGALLVLYVARMVHVWFALQDILELPNVVRIHRDKRSPLRHSPV
jgi:hypothetical protein